MKCCDLLEKSYFCSIANNQWGFIFNCSIVVICLKNRTFAVSQTTKIGKPEYKFVLWFAWKIVLLQYRKQQVLAMNMQSNVVICLKNRTFAVSQTTTPVPSWMGNPVVICLKNRTFAVSQTTTRSRTALSSALWFAWKIVLLQYRKQPWCPKYLTNTSCDLLEKSYFCSIANNKLIQ